VAVLQESKTYATEKSDVHQGFQVLCAYLVDIVVCSRPVQNLSILVLLFWFGIYLYNLFLLHLRVLVLWRVQLACLSIVDIIVNCLFSMWHNPSVFVQYVVERD
jgi:hypothetical protein